MIAVYAKWDFANVHGVGWGWAGVIWLYSIIFYIPLDLFKFLIRYAISGKGWNGLINSRVRHSMIEIVCFITLVFIVMLIRYFFQIAFTTKKDYGKGEREAQWALAQRTLHGLQPPDTSEQFNDKNNYRELSEIAEQAKRRAEVAR